MSNRCPLISEQTPAHRAIQDRLTGQHSSIDAISRVLHLSPRTLQRRLQESGSSFQRVLDEARHQMARYYLSGSGLELNEAAYLLGFEDRNSFGHAFRAWEGVPPRDWRETHRASTAEQGKSCAPEIGQGKLACGKVFLTVPYGSGRVTANSIVFLASANVRDPLITAAP